ncbi:MAG: type II toxin-antitoxin system mRNA interferase toxin, RelE/StbE family [Candidatus Pacearchaeota archaeon]|jgi:YafQ family addiction module toxin component
MVYELQISKEADKKFNKISKKNKKLLEIINKKIQQILLNPYHFKPLTGKMKNIFRVHIDKSFVLTYEVLEIKKIVRILDFDHHDKIYLK